MARLWQQTYFVLRHRYLFKFKSFFRRKWLSLVGMHIGKGTLISKVYTTWPQQVRIGNSCKIEPDVYFKYSGIWNPGPSIRIGDFTFIGMGCEFNIHHDLSIGNNCLIASGCRFIDHDHGIATSELIRFQPSVSGTIEIDDNVWLGCNVVVLKSVKIGNGAVVAAGAVVTKSIASNEIWGGVPARKIGVRNVESAAG